MSQKHRYTFRVSGRDVSVSARLLEALTVAFALESCFTWEDGEILLLHVEGADESRIMQAFKRYQFVSKTLVGD